MHMLVLNGIEIGTITVKNQQINAICERLHQSIGNSLCTSYVKGSSSNQGISSSEYCGYQFAASYAARATIYSTLCIFTRNMGFPTYFDYRYIIDIGNQGR